MRTPPPFIAVLAALLLLLTLAPAGAQEEPDDDGAVALVADAFGVDGDLSLAGENILDVGPVPEVEVVMPPQVETVTASVLDLSLPADGEVGSVDLLEVEAYGRLADGTAGATSQVEGLALLQVLIAPATLGVDVIRAEVNVECQPTFPSLEEVSEGTQVAGLTVLGQEIPVDPGPNTEIELPGIGTAIANEVIPDTDGLGFTVYGLHVFGDGTVFEGDLILGAAHANVVCEDGPEGTNPDLDDRDLRIDKRVQGAETDTVTTAAPGDEVTYELTVTNQSDDDCTLRSVTDRLPRGFSYVPDSETGFLDPSTVTLNDNRVTFTFDVEPVVVGAGESVTGTFDALIGDDVPPGLFFDDAEVRSTCGTARTGPTAPVEIPAPEPPAPPVPGPCIPDDLGDPEVPRVERIDGIGRIETAVRVSNCFFPDPDPVDTVIIGRADIYADSLAGGPLAVDRTAPILYTPTNELAEPTDIELNRLDPQLVILLGGTDAIAQNVEDEIAAQGYDILRLGGLSRFETAVLVAEELDSSTGRAFITEGGAATPDRGWPDAMSASPYAGALGDPILLVTEVSFDENTEAALADMGITETVVVGGTSAVNADVFDQIAQNGHSPRRLAGGNRYETSAAVYAEQVSEAGLDPSVLNLATGNDWMDALVTGPAAANVGQTFALVDGTDLDASPAIRTLIEDNADTINIARLVGGPATISELVEQQVADVIGADLSRSTGDTTTDGTD